jgi:hypothetical protein
MAMADYEINSAMEAAEKGVVGEFVDSSHVALILREEVLRLRNALESAPAEEDMPELMHREVIEALMCVTSIVALKGSQPQIERTAKDAVDHLRRALGLDPQYQNVSI